MSAYAALVSLRHIIEQIQHHPRPPISIDKKPVESLIEKVTFLQDFLEGYSFNGGIKEAEALESRIADAAYAAEDIIESHIVNQFLPGSTSTRGKQVIEFYQRLQKVIYDMDFIKRKVSTEIKKEIGSQDQLLHGNSMSADSPKLPSTGQNTMVGLDDVKIEIMDKLTGQQYDRQIIPIVGMGGIDCHVELEDIGKTIAKNCKGLPLSIVVIGGLLAKSKRGREFWQHVAENLNSIVKLEDNERCSNILQMSYNQLPVHLKPCFLYMGVYPEDYEIDVPNLMKLWVAEGFLKPISGKSLEVVAEEYFNDLVDRNLIFVSSRKYSGKIKYCRIHDLLLDLCMSEAQRHKFLYVTRKHNLNNIPQGVNIQRRIVVHEGTAPEVIDALPSALLVRSLTRKSYCFPRSLKYRLLRVWNGNDTGAHCFYSLESSRGLVNCRYLDSIYIPKPNSRSSPFPLYLFWNLQTLIVTSGSEGSVVIWKMPQLRHVKFDLLHLPDPTRGDDFVLENLQTLSTVRDFEFGN